MRIIQEGSSTMFLTKLNARKIKRYLQLFFFWSVSVSDNKIKVQRRIGIKQIILSFYHYRAITKVQRIDDLDEWLLLVTKTRYILSILGHHKPLLKASLLTSNKDLALELTILTVWANPRVGDYRRFRHCVEINNFPLNDLSREIEKGLSYKKINQYKLYCLKELNLDISVLDELDLIYFYYLSKQYSKVLELAFNIENIKSVPSKYCDFVVKCMILENHDYSNVIQSLWYQRSSSKLRTEFLLSQGMFKAGMKEKTNRDMSIMLNRLYPEKFKKSLSAVDKSSTLHILNSWGPGDDVRFSVVVDMLISLGYGSIVLHTEPRLVPLLSLLYPEISIDGTYRSKLLSHHNISHFDKLYPQNLHHVFDNEFFSKIGDISQFTLVTNLLHELLVGHMTFNDQRKLSNLNNCFSEAIDDFISSLGDNKVIVGISWRSMVSQGVRGQDNFSIADVQDVVEGMEDLVLVCLQYDNCEMEVTSFNQSSKVKMHVPPIDQMNDFASVVYLMNKLDLIICTGNSVLEFAGCSTTETLAVLLDPVHSYRFFEGKDIWFNNITIPENPKSASLVTTKKLVRTRLLRVIDKNE